MEKAYYLIKLEITSLKCEKDFFLASLDEIDVLIINKFNELNPIKDQELKRGLKTNEVVNSKLRAVEVASKEAPPKSAPAVQRMDVFPYF